MSSKEDLLEKKEEEKKRMPSFKNYMNKKEAPENWRKQKGHHNKVRKEKRGYPSKVKVGYRTPKKTRGLTKNGLQPVLVKNKKGIENLDAEEECAVLSSNIGAKKLLSLLKEVKKREITVHNYDVEEKISRIQQKFKERKKKRKKKEEEKEKKKEEEKKELEEKVEEDSEKEEEKSEEKEQKEGEEKSEKEKEKEVKDKVLTKKR